MYVFMYVCIYALTSEETANSFFTDIEKDVISNYIAKMGELRILAIQLKESLLSRGKFHPNVTYYEVVQNSRFMSFWKA